MNILAIEEGFPPELMSSHFALEFVQELAKHGNLVSVVTVFPRKHLLMHPINLPRHKFFYWDLNYGNIRVLRVFPQFQSKSKIGRAIEYLFSSIVLFLGGLLSGKKDIIHVGTPPLFMAFTACILAKLKHVPIVLRIWDIHPDALEKIGIIQNKFIINMMKIIEKLVYRYVDHITVISRSYRDYLIREGVPNNKMTTIPNWTMLKMCPSYSDYEFRKTFGLEDKFIVTYAGSLSWINDLETIIKSANLLKENNDIVFVFFGDGTKRNETIQLSKSLELHNTLFIPPKPLETYLKILFESDTCIVSLHKDFTSPALPARIPSILKCAKSIIANVPSGSDTFYLIKDAKCGIWVNSGDADALAAAVLDLSTDSKRNELLGTNGRKYVENNFSISSCMSLYNQVLRQQIEKRKG